MEGSARVRVFGPLSKYISGFAAELTKQGYSESSVAKSSPARKASLSVARRSPPRRDGVDVGTGGPVSRRPSAKP